jgi:hypothetical protein
MQHGSQLRPERFQPGGVGAAFVAGSQVPNQVSDFGGC